MWVLRALTLSRVLEKSDQHQSLCRLSLPGLNPMRVDKIWIYAPFSDSSCTQLGVRVGIFPKCGSSHHSSSSLVHYWHNEMSSEVVFVRHDGYSYTGRCAIHHLLASSGHTVHVGGVDDHP